MTPPADLDRQFDAFRNDFESLRREIGKRVVGRREAVEGLLTALVAGGHVLLEGLPGTGKTFLARTLAEVLNLVFHRIQCTPDLMPSDVIGTYVIQETPQGRRTFEFHKGPLFANLVLADHANRAMPKTQSALLEAMEEESVSVGTESFPLPRPYLLVATQDPLEEGTYPLPEAQLDRFLFKLLLPSLSPEELDEVVQRATDARSPVQKLIDCRRLLEMSETARQVAVPAEVRRRIVARCAALDPNRPGAPEIVRRFVRHGAGPRGAMAIVRAAQVHAILAGREQASDDDARRAAPAALRHRVALNFEGHAEGISPDVVIDAVPL